jgi:hypothetical protein
MSEIKYLYQADPENITPHEMLKKQIKNVRNRLEYYRRDREDAIFKNEDEMMKKLEYKLQEKRNDLQNFKTAKPSQDPNIRRIRAFSEVNHVKIRSKTDSGLVTTKSGHRVLPKKKKHNPVILPHMRKNMFNKSGLDKSMSPSQSFTNLVHVIQDNLLMPDSPFKKPFDVDYVPMVNHLGNPCDEPNPLYDDPDQKYLDPNNLKTTINPNQVMRKRLEDIEDHISRRFYLQDRNKIEAAIKDNDYHWVANL